MLNSNMCPDFFLSSRVLKIQRILNVENSTLRAHEAGKKCPLKC